MIQVIVKVFNILEQMEPGRGVSLNEITQATKLNKGTACNILKTLVNIGYLEKTKAGHYQMTKKFLALSRPLLHESGIVALCEKFAQRLAEQTSESGVISTLRDNKVCILAQAQHQRRVMVSISNYKELSLYHSVSGRILLSYLDDDKLPLIVEKLGLPGDEWDSVHSMKALEKARDSIRQAGLSVMGNPDDEISAYAAPVFDASGKICAAIGLSVPIFRLDNGNRETMLESLRANAQDLGKAIAAQRFQQKDFMRFQQ